MTIDVPVLQGMRHRVPATFEDMLQQVVMMMRQGQQKGNGKIAGASYHYEIGWDQEVLIGDADE